MMSDKHVPKNNLLMGVSAAALLAGSMSTIAYSQTVPAGCLPTAPIAGDVVNCVVAAPGTVDGIFISVDDLTINFGDTTTPTSTADGVNVGIQQFGEGDQTLNIINTGSLVRGSIDGVFVEVIGGNGDVVVNSEGTVNGARRGIVAINKGTGSVTVNAVSATGTTFAGVLAQNTNTAATGDISVTTTGLIRGGRYGIYTEMSGTGGVTVNATSVTGVTDIGIRARVSNEAATGNISVTATGAVSGDTGISAINQGAGNVTVNAASVTADSGDGITALVFLAGSTSDISVTATDTVSSNSNGIVASHSGRGNVTVETMAVTGDANEKGTGGGIIAQILSPTGIGNISVTANGAVSGGRDGIAAFNSGNGGVTVNAKSVTGDVDGDGTGHGILASAAGKGDISISATGAVIGGRDGIRALSLGTGDITINAASVTGVNDDGIFAFGNGAITIDTTAGTVSSTGTGVVLPEGDDNGISATATGDTGDIIITTADVTADGDDGIDAKGKNSININSTAGTVTARDDGIFSLASGPAGSVSVTTAAVTSVNASGVFAQMGGTGTGNISVTAFGVVSGGADGIGAFNFGVGDVLISTNDDVTGGNNGIRSLVRATGKATVFINGGTVQGGTGAGVELSGSAGSTSILNSAASNLFALSGLAVQGSEGNENINNTGTITGNISLGGGIDALNNNAGGVFNAGLTVSLGAGEQFTNAGTFSPGGDGAIGPTTVTGNLNQTATGNIKIDVDAASKTNDFVTVNGTADLAGTVDVNLTTGDPLGTFTILTATGGVTDNGLLLGAVTGIINPLTQLELLFPNANDLALGFSLETTAGNFNRNQTSILANINAINRLGGGGLGPVTNALFGLGSIAETADALDRLLPEVYLNTETMTLFAAQEFTDNLFSCQVADGEFAVVREGDCLWLRPQGRLFQRDTTFEHIGFEETAGGLSVGGQVRIDRDWVAGIAAGFEQGGLYTNTGASSDSYRFHAGGILKYQDGPLVLAGAVTGGIGSYDTTRTVNFGGLNASNSSDHDIRYFSTRFRAAYLLEQDGFYAKPFVDVDVTYLDRDGFNETGSPDTGFVVRGGSDTFVSATPAIELGAEHSLSQTQVIRAYLKAGASLYMDDEHSLSAGFLGAPATAPDFRITTQFDNAFADLEAGVTFLDNDSATVQFGYQGRVSGNTSQHGAFVKANMDF